MLTFSVVIPTRNRVPKLARALESVLRQTLAPKDVIIVDDASDGEDKRQLLELVRPYPQVKLIALERNGGASAARNIGIAQASGDVVAFLDSDDWWTRDRLQEHQLLLEGAPDCPASYNPCLMAKDDNDRNPGRYGKPPPKVHMRAALAGWNFIGGSSSVCVRRSCLLKIGGFDEKLPSCQDWDVWLRVAKFGDFAFCGKRMTSMDVGLHERITTSSRKVFDGHRILFEKLAHEPWTRAERRKIDAQHRWIEAELYARFGQTGDMMRAMVSSFLTRPTSTSLRRLGPLLLQSGKKAMLAPLRSA